MANKGNIEPIGNKFYNISAGDIMHYLENDVLGFRIDADFTRWTGINAAHSYVRMRVVIQAKDLIVNNNVASDDFATRILQQNQTGYELDKDVVKALEPFMYPKNFSYEQLTPEAARHLNSLGVIGPKLDELIRNAQLTLATSPENGRQYFRVYLRPERIISEMLSDPRTGKPDGDIYIRRVTGETSSDFRWLVEQISNVNNVIGTDLSIDQIFAMK